MVFVTKYRRGELRSEHLQLLEDVFADVCSDFGATLVESKGEDDHVPLLVEYPPTMATLRPGQLPQRRFQPTPAPAFEIGAHRHHLWSLSYFAESADGAPLSIIRQYVEARRQPA